MEQIAAENVIEHHRSHERWVSARLLLNDARGLRLKGMVCKLRASAPLAQALALARRPVCLAKRVGMEGDCRRTQIFEGEEDLAVVSRVMKSNMKAPNGLRSRPLAFKKRPSEWIRATKRPLFTSTPRNEGPPGSHCPSTVRPSLGERIQNLRG